jgi:hypothetical protein
MAELKTGVKSEVKRPFNLKADLEVYENRKIRKDEGLSSNRTLSKAVNFSGEVSLCLFVAFVDPHSRF